METRTIRVKMDTGAVRTFVAEVSHTKMGIARYQHPGKKTVYGNIQKFLDSRVKGHWVYII